jgi:NADPH:quinone reductase-like Zn-dependent oxidoreductase
MKAIIRRRYGPPDVLELVDLERPDPADDEVLVRVRAASVNPADWYTMTGWLYLFRAKGGLFKPKDPRLGTDFAGVVEAVGANVTHVQPGDEVFGGRSGALAEYVVVKNAVTGKPSNLTFEQAAALPVAAITALQGLRDHGQVGPGHKVLINGASGGVGTFAVQVAKALGAHVTAVCSTGKVDLVRGLGAGEVIDYTREDFSRSGARYDVILDIAGSRRWSALARVLAPRGIVVVVGAGKGNRLLGPLSHIVRIKVRAMFSRRKAVFFIARLTRDDLEVLRDMIEAGQVTPVVERTYPLVDAADAFRHLGEGHARGKVVVTL